MLDKPRTPGQLAAKDWAGLRRRLETSQLDGEIAISPEDRQRILRQRAQLLAKERHDDKMAGEMLAVVEFQLAYERYAVESSFLQEIRPLKDLTPLPGTPGFVLGVINVRSQILSVMDLKKFFDLPEKGLTDLNKVMIVQHGAMHLGILADRIEGIRAISAQDLQTSLPTLTGIRADYLRGVTREGVVLLDIRKILSDEKMVVQQ